MGIFIFAHNLHNQLPFPLCLLGRASLQQTQQKITLATALLLFMCDGKNVAVGRQVGTGKEQERKKATVNMHGLI